MIQRYSTIIDVLARPGFIQEKSRIVYNINERSFCNFCLIILLSLYCSLRGSEIFKMMKNLLQHKNSFIAKNIQNCSCNDLFYVLCFMLLLLLLLSCCCSIFEKRGGCHLVWNFHFLIDFYNSRKWSLGL